MRRLALSAALVAAVLLVQLTIVNRVPLPGGGAPNLVLLLVIALAMCGGPGAGVVTGFAAGLCLDLAPPATQIVGGYALVFCLIGYLCGLLRGVLARSALLPLVLAAGAAVLGEAMYAGLSLVVDKSQVTVAAVRHVLPASALYDVALSSLVLYLVVLASRSLADSPADHATALQQGDASARLRRARADGSTAPVLRQAGLASPAASGMLLGGTGLLGRAGWIAGPAGSRAARRAERRGPRARSSAHLGDGWLGYGPPTWRTLAGPQRQAAVPRLRPANGVAGSAARLQAGPARWSARPVNLHLAAGRRRAQKARQSAGASRRGLPRISFSAGGSAARPAPTRRGLPRISFSGGSTAARPAASRPVRSPSFKSSPTLRGGSASQLATGHALAGPRPGARTPSPGTFSRQLGPRAGGLRLGGRRSRDGIVGGGALTARSSRPRRAAAPRFHLRRAQPSMVRRTAAASEFRAGGALLTGGHGPAFGGSGLSGGLGGGSGLSQPRTVRFRRRRRSPLAFLTRRGSRRTDFSQLGRRTGG
ncbi:MAG TPA: rod shape-determining protein MreD [Streptosporangiaceae bacterium]